MLLRSGVSPRSYKFSKKKAGLYRSKCCPRLEGIFLPCVTTALLPVPEACWESPCDFVNRGLVSFLSWSREIFFFKKETHVTLGWFAFWCWFLSFLLRGNNLRCLWKTLSQDFRRKDIWEIHGCLTTRIWVTWRDLKTEHSSLCFVLWFDIDLRIWGCWGFFGGVILIWESFDYISNVATRMGEVGNKQLNVIYANNV